MKPIYETNQGKKTNIYVMTCGEFQKIGMSEKPESRLKHIQTSNPMQVRLTYHQEVFVFRALEIEKDAHKTLKDCRVYGEWFKCAPEEAIETVKQSILKLNKDGFNSLWIVGYEKEPEVEPKKTRSNFPWIKEGYANQTRTSKLTK